jgi:hypothetical protein
LRKMHADVPSPVRAFASGNRGLTFDEALAEQIGDVPCGLLVANRETGAMGGGGAGRGHQVFRRFLSAVAMICITFYKLRRHQ